jgi:hypothetical protein
MGIANGINHMVIALSSRISAMTMPIDRPSINGNYTAGFKLVMVNSAVWPPVHVCNCPPAALALVPVMHATAAANYAGNPKSNQPTTRPTPLTGDRQGGPYRSSKFAVDTQLGLMPHGRTRPSRVGPS